MFDSIFTFKGGFDVTSQWESQRVLNPSAVVTLRHSGVVLHSVASAAAVVSEKIK